ncbi:MmgE/PrpD family protein [Pseudonocardia acaciae]|uniref:MmgE/PrpD family protein n=1 Tax=Pseudonocardia acaciae TaxID=551276 RepID=UPI0006844E8F|nr:MmgE/PrpD family protein [Pseudonocardia acaciae]
MTAAPHDAAELWRLARRAADTADEHTLARAAGCLAAALVDMIASARDERYLTVARALAAEPGPCTVTGLTGGRASGAAVIANAFLTHARLTDDSYRVAAHPGLAVVPPALAAVEARAAAGRPVRGRELLRALVGGYECGCLLADALLPEVSRRGWRVTSAIAPLAAAATTALLHELSDADAAHALALAASGAGGPLAVVSGDGDAWRLQPALATGSGVYATSAAMAGLGSGPGVLSGRHGLYSLLGGSAQLSDGRPAAVHRVTFKRHPVAMYGQSVFEALRSSPAPNGQLRRVVVRLAPFAAAYGHDSDTASIASIQGITHSALRTFHAARAEVPVEVVGDPALGDLTAVLDLVFADARTVTLTGDGDTSGWTAPDFHDHCTARAGAHGESVLKAATALLTVPDTTALLTAWRA